MRRQIDTMTQKMLLFVMLSLFPAFYFLCFILYFILTSNNQCVLQVKGS